MNTLYIKTRSLRSLGAVLPAILSLAPLCATAQTNTATGGGALFANTTGNYNTADGFAALNRNTTGSYNTASGFDSLASNTTAYYNTASGTYALAYNTTGTKNSAFGMDALLGNTTGSYNTASGCTALSSNSTGSYDIANGYGSLYSNTTGISNTASGYESLYNNTKGSYNTAYGLYALVNLNGDGGSKAATAGNYNIGLGSGAGQNLTTGSYNIAIGNSGNAADNGIIRIGTQGTQAATFIAGISGVTSSNGVPVYINANGQLGTLTSSARFKFDIQSLGKISDRLMYLRPVSFRYKEAASDGSHPMQYGLIAEEVAKVYPDMVQYDKEGKPFTVFYQQLTPMMLNELQKAHQHAKEQDTQIAELKAEVAELKPWVEKQSGETKPASGSGMPLASALAACLAGAFFLSIRLRR